MAQPYVGEIRIFAGNFAPQGWMLCEGQLLDIATYTTLFQLIGTIYGGDGLTTFALPDLRGRLPLHQGSNGMAAHFLGELAGVEQVTLTVPQMFAHSHTVAADQEPADSAHPTGRLLAEADFDPYSSAAPSGAMSPLSTSVAGGNQPHGNFMQYLCVNFIISLFGIYPTP